MRLQGGTFPFGEGPYPSHPSPLATQERTDEEKMDEWAEDQGSQEITDEMNNPPGYSDLNIKKPWRFLHTRFRT